MAFNINEFQGAMKLGGARNSLFQVTISNPVSGIADAVFPFMCRTASLPSSTVAKIPVKYFGRDVNFAGNRTFDDWQVTILNDEDFLIRHAIEQWSNSINSMKTNLRDFESSSPVLYKADAQVTQFSKTGVPVRVYNMVGMFPILVSEIALDWSNADTIEEFTVTFAYDYWQVTGGVTGTITN